MASDMTSKDAMACTHVSEGTVAPLRMDLKAEINVATTLRGDIADIRAMIDRISVQVESASQRLSTRSEDVSIRSAQSQVTRLAAELSRQLSAKHPAVIVLECAAEHLKLISE